MTEGHQYPLHDINKVFDMFEEIINKGGTSENTADEMIFLNRLFAALPPEAVEYGMKFLHGSHDLPKSCDEILPLYIRFKNLADYLSKIEALRVFPAELTEEAILERQREIESLEEHEKMFGRDLLGYRLRSGGEPEEIKEDGSEDNAGSSDDNSGDNGKLHLMNASAPVFCCPDMMKTAIFYEDKLGFKAAHLSDERMEHIRLTRDNIAIVLTQRPRDCRTAVTMRDLYGIKYDMYIYVSEPFLLMNELRASGVKITEELPTAENSVGASHNRQFVFEDNDGRRICVSQSDEMV